MDKSALSSLITGLRPMVKQATVHTIHKLSRQIKLCSRRPGFEQSRKLKQRVAHFKEEILVMKNIHLDTVIKTALVIDFNEREKILNDVHEAVEKKVIVRLATYKSVMNRIKHIREKYSDWESKIPVLLESFYCKVEKNNGSSKSILEKKEKTTKKLCKSAYADTKSKECVTSNSSDVKRKEKKREHGTEVHINSFNIIKTESSDAFKMVECKGTSPDLCEENSELQNNRHSHLSKAEVCPLSVLLQEEYSTPHRKSESNTDIPSTLENVCTENTIFEEDTFFVTKDNDFLKTKLVNTELNVKDSKINHTTSIQSQIISKVDNQDGVLIKIAAVPDHLKSEVKRQRHPSLKNLERKNLDSDFGKRYGMNSNSEEKLHPSWEAKRKQKYGVIKFSGSKMKFNYEGSCLLDNLQPKQADKKNLQTTEESKLHPSWEAKRKQHVSIGAFQGKKTTFEDL